MLDDAGRASACQRTTVAAPTETIRLNYIASGLHRLVDTCCDDERWQLAVDTPAYDVDHEVYVVLNRFNVCQNLVINMIWARAGRTGLGG